MTVNELIESLKKLSREKGEYEVHIDYDYNSLGIEEIRPFDYGKIVELVAYDRSEEDYYSSRS